MTISKPPPLIAAAQVKFRATDVQLFLLGELDLARAVNLQMAVTGVAVDRDRGGAEYRGAQAFSSIQATRSPLQATSPHRICHEPLAARWFASLQAQNRLAPDVRFREPR